MQIFTLPVPPSANSLFLTLRTRRRVITPRYRAWRFYAQAEILRQRVRPVAGPVEIEYLISDKHSRKRDTDNFAKPLGDCLVDNGIIETDLGRIVRRLTLAWSHEVVDIRVCIRPI